MHGTSGPNTASQLTRWQRSTTAAWILVLSTTTSTTTTPRSDWVATRTSASEMDVDDEDNVGDALGLLGPPIARARRKPARLDHERLGNARHSFPEHRRGYVPHGRRQPATGRAGKG